MQNEGTQRGAQFVRVAETNREAIQFYLNGVACTGLAGDSVLTAILTHQPCVRSTEFSQEPRAGFCLIGACQDCWVWHEDGSRLRACTTRLREGARLCTKAPQLSGGAL